jgi:hypothetical protein
MNKSKKRTTSTIISMTVFAVVALMLYYYWINRTEPLEETTRELTEIEKVLEKDLDSNYPKTPREVVKLYSNMLKLIYTDLEEEELEALAWKIRELYDLELIEKNPEDEYLNKLYMDIDEWKKAGRSISNYLIVDKESEQQKEIDDREYAIVYVTYTIQEKGKFSEKWRFLLRKDSLKKWKILGWEYAPREN